MAKKENSKPQEPLIKGQIIEIKRSTGDGVNNAWKPITDRTTTPPKGDNADKK